jgi:hypothetical protein
LNPAISVETEVYTTQAGEWETLSFDLSQQVVGTQPLNINNTYDLITIFFDFGTAGGDVGDQIFYFDDVSFGDWSSDITNVSVSSMRMYPSLLANGQVLTLESDVDQSFVFKVMDGVGRIVFEEQCQGTKAVVLPSLAAGVYHATMQSGEGQTKQTLVIH